LSIKKLLNTKTAEKIHVATMSIMLSVMVLSIFYQVISRYFINFSLTWAEELARGCFIWMVLLGLSFVERNDEPIKITILRDLMSCPVQKVINVLAMVLSLVFCVICSYYGIDRVLFLMKSGQIAPGLQISMVWFYLAMPVGFVLTTIVYLLKFIRLFKGRSIDQNLEGKEIM